MPSRPCLDCGQPFTPTPTMRSRCPAHHIPRERARQAARDAARPSPRERGYTAEHTRARAALAARLARGEALACWRCANPITTNADLVLGHDDADRSVTRGPEHRSCNARTREPGRATSATPRGAGWLA